MRHGWTLRGGGPHADFIEAAAAAVPDSIAARIGACEAVLVRVLDPPEVTSEWSESGGIVSIRLSEAGIEPHDLALEYLFCIGQAAWERLEEGESSDWLRLLGAEVGAGVEGEIDEDTMEEKRRAVANPADTEQLERYIASSFAASVAEYIHALWHDVHVRTGPEHLPSEWLRRRLEWCARLFPPSAGQRLFPEDPDESG